jgi:hypothetical protein
MSRKDQTLKRVLKLDPGLVIIFVLPLLLLISNTNWTFNPPLSIDPWLYNGFFVRFEQHLKAFAETYYATRLSWIIPGYIIYNLFPPIVANYVLHLAVYYIATLSLYLTLKLTISPKTALFTAVLMGCHPYFFGATGWDYVDGAGIAYYLFTILMLTCGALLPCWKPFLLMAGIACGATVYTNITWIGLMPTLIIYYYLLNRFHRRNSIPFSIFLFGIGILFVSGLLGVINYSINQRFFFFLPSILVAKNLSSQANPWALDWRSWLPRASWLLLPTFVFLGSIWRLFLIRKKLSKSESLNPNLPVFQVCCVANGIAMLIIQIMGTPVLQISYYASYLIPFTFLALGSMLNFGIRRFKSYNLALLTIGITSLTVLLLNDSSNVFKTVALLLCLFVVGACLLNQYINGKQLTPSGLAFLVVLLGIYISANVHYLIFYFQVSDFQFLALKSKPEVSQTIRRTSPQETFLATMKTQALLKEIDPKVELMFWYNAREATVYISIASSNLWGYRLIGENFPSLNSPADNPQSMDLKVIKERLKRVSKIMIMSQQPNALEQAKNSLNQVGFDAKFLSQYTISQGNITFTSTIIELSDNIKK